MAKVVDIADVIAIDADDINYNALKAFIECIYYLYGKGYSMQDIAAVVHSTTESVYLILQYQPQIRKIFGV